MKVGDLVKYWGAFPGSSCVVLVIEKGVYVGSRDIKVLCGDGNVKMAKSSEVEAVNESR